MPKEEYSIGDQLKHKLFCKGTILAIEDVEKSCKLTIKFKGEVSKKIMANFVKHV